MANKKITELTALTTPDNADLFAIVDISLPETKKITFADLKTAVISGLTSVYQPLNSKLTTFAALADAAGVLTSDGAGNYSWGSAGSGLSPTGSDVGATSQIQVFTNGIKTAAQDAVDIRPFGVSAGNTGELRFYELVASGSNYAAIKAPDAFSSSFTMTYTWPAILPVDNQVLGVINVVGSEATLFWKNPGVPGGLNKAVQFNNAGDFGGDEGRFIWEVSGDQYQIQLQNNNGISYPSYSFIDAPTMGMYYDSGNVGITADSGNVLLTCAGLSINGNAGASGTGTVISSITVVNGIITAITVS